MVRGAVYSLGFLAMIAFTGAIRSWWALAALPPRCWCAPPSPRRARR